MHEPSLSQSLRRLGCFSGTLRPSSTPDPHYTPVADLPALRGKQGWHASIAVTPILSGQAHNRRRQCGLIQPRLWLIAHCRTRDAQHPADASFRVFALLLDVPHDLSSSRWAQYFPSAASFRSNLSTVRSATARFSRAFSVSSSFSRFA